MHRMIPHNKPTLGSEEEAAAAAVIVSGWIAEGKRVEEFEDALCRYQGVPAGRAAAVSSGTAALYLALRSLHVQQKGVIVPTYVCSAVLNAIHMAGARPVLADIDPDDLNISLVEAKKKIDADTGAIIVTHTFGMPAHIDGLIDLGIPVIEDCAQALGACINGEPVGRRGSIATFSSYASKMITTGYGGMVVSSDKKLVDSIRDYRAFDGRETYEPRFNFHLSDINAAIGSVQLGKLDGFLHRRREIAERYASRLPVLDLWPHADDSRNPNFYRIILRTPSAQELKAHLAEKGVSTIVPIERFELLHRYLGQDPSAFPVAEAATDTTLSLPAYPSLTDAEVDSIAAVVSEFLSTV